MNDDLNKKIVSAIVPVFNEEKTISGVAQALLQSDLIDEVICINDGSSDESLSILNSFGKKIKLIDLKKNKGKGYALSQGIRKAKGEVVVFFDADITNLSDEHIKILLAPILEGKAEAVLGFPLHLIVDHVFKDITGERAYYRKDLLPLLKEMADSRFGVEVLLNEAFKKRKVEKVHLTKIKLLFKTEKRGVFEAYKEGFFETRDVASHYLKRKLNFINKQK